MIYMDIDMFESRLCLEGFFSIGYVLRHMMHDDE